MARTKVCSKCKKRKPLFNFTKNKSREDGYSYWCKSCKNKWRSNWRKENKEKNKQSYDRANFKKSLKNFNLTLEEYDRLFEQQNGVCAICGQPESRKMPNGGTYRLNIDHNHQTGKVRGILCAACNLALGKLKIDEKGIDLLLKAIEYVRKCDE